MRTRSVVAAFAALLALPAGRASALVLTNCEALLGDNVYRCSVQSDRGDAFEDCFRFSEASTVSENFDVHVDGVGTTLACDCRARGTLKNVQFGASTEFQCVTPPNDNLQIAFTGRAASKGTKLRNVQGVNELGESFFAECVRDPACAIESLAGAAVGSPYRKR